jgi:hypothetical protein
MALWPDGPYPEPGAPPGQIIMRQNDNSSLSQLFARRAELITDSRTLGLVIPLAALHHFSQANRASQPIV